MINYSKKIIKYFLHPKNMGRLKNPDGVGVAGNIFCLLPDTEIQTNIDLKPISSLTIKDKVLGHNGKFNKIKRTIKRQYTGKIIRIKNRLGVTSLTPEHECLAIRLPKTHHFLYLKNKRKQLPEWCHAEEIEKGDILLYPILQESKDLTKVEINDKKPKYDFRNREFPSRVIINNDFLRLAGYFLSEGYISQKMCNMAVNFTFNLNEESYINDIKQIAKTLFNIEAKIYKYPQRQTLRISLYSAPLVRFFNKLFGNYADRKKTPYFMMLLPPEKQKSLIVGLWRGDGFVNKNIPRAGYSTISYYLWQQMKILLIRQGIIPSLYSEKARIKNGVSHKKSYRIHIGHRPSFLKILDILNVELNIKKCSYLDAWVDNDFIYVPVTEIKKENYKGYVYNLEVDELKSFVTTSATVHNCGDEMKIYIKVKNDIIKDIKFETLGCAAAIATSSMITELVKGRTLSEALKISRQDVADELGGLSPIKMHCSNMAVEALRQAIEDYQGKLS